MRKTFVSGVAALLLAASTGALAASAEKIGNVNQDDKVDIEDAVAVINHVNGVNSLSDFEELIADVDCNDTVDIEDAVRIINHINGITPLPDTEVFTASAKSQVKFWFSPESYKNGKNADFIYYLYEEDAVGSPTVLTADEYNTASFIPGRPEGMTGWIDMSTNDFVKGDITGDKELVACFTPISCNVKMYDSFTDYKNKKVSKDITLFENNTAGLPTSLAYGEYSKIIPAAPNDDMEFDSWFSGDISSNGLADPMLGDIKTNSNKQLDMFAGFKYKEGHKPELDEGEYWITVYNDSSENLSLGFSDNGMIKYFQEKTTKLNTIDGNQTTYMSKLRVIPAGGKSFSYGVYSTTNNEYAKGGKITINCILASGANQTLEFDPYEVCDENHCIELHINPGARTVKLFDEIADGNYKFNFQGKGTVLGKDTDIDATIMQATSDKSRVIVKMPGRGIDSDLVIEGSKKYKIVDFEGKKYTAKLSNSEKLMDFNKIFSSISANKDSMKFVNETVDTENGLVTEKFTAVITSPVNADVVIEASYSTDSGELKKLVMYTNDYLSEDVDTTVYISTDSLNFQKNYDPAENDIPDMSDWQKVD